MNTPQTNSSPEFQAACEEYAALERNGFGSMPEALAAMQRMLDLAPSNAIGRVMMKAQQIGLLPADMQLKGLDEYDAKVASIEAIAKAMRKGGSV